MGTALTLRILPWLFVCRTVKIARLGFALICFLFLFSLHTQFINSSERGGEGGGSLRPVDGARKGEGGTLARRRELVTPIRRLLNRYFIDLTNA